MILDKLLEFSDSQGAITSSAVSTNVVDLGAGPTLRDLGAGEIVWFVVQVDVTGTGAGTLTIQLVSCATAAEFAAQTTPHIHYQSPAIVGTDMVAGDELVKVPLASSSFLLAVDQQGAGYERFLGCNYTIASTVGAVKLSAFLVKQPQTNIAYPSGFTAS